MKRRCSSHHDCGAADALGIVLVAPVAIGLALLVVFLSRQVDSRAQVRTAAESAAQAAAQERSPAAAEIAAHHVVETMLLDPDTCTSPAAVVDLTRFAPGGIVAVTVSCSVSDRGIELIAPDDPAQRRFTVTASATIDRYRATEVAP